MRFTCFSGRHIALVVLTVAYSGIPALAQVILRPEQTSPPRLLLPSEPGLPVVDGVQPSEALREPDSQRPRRVYFPRPAGDFPKTPEDGVQYGSLYDEVDSNSLDLIANHPTAKVLLSVLDRCLESARSNESIAVSDQKELLGSYINLVLPEDKVAQAFLEECSRALDQSGRAKKGDRAAYCELAACKAELYALASATADTASQRAIFQGGARTTYGESPVEVLLDCEKRLIMTQLSLNDRISKWIHPQPGQTLNATPFRKLDAYMQVRMAEQSRDHALKFWRIQQTKHQGNTATSGSMAQAQAELFRAEAQVQGAKAKWWQLVEELEGQVVPCNPLSFRTR
jgi:hypothetical protein